MNHVLYVLSFLAFLTLPIPLLAFRQLRHIPWWVVFLSMAVLGWLFVNAGVRFYYDYLGDLVAAYGDKPPLDLLDRWSADGAKLVFALFFGWLYALIYLLPWLVIYGAAHGIHGLFTKHRLAAAQPPADKALQATSKSGAPDF